jgi:hypothetical protein
LDANYWLRKKVSRSQTKEYFSTDCIMVINELDRKFANKRLGLLNKIWQKLRKN